MLARKLIKDSHDEIDLTVDWSKVLHPGQIIRMHMVGWNLMEPALCSECETLCVTLTRRGLHWRLLEVYSFVHSVPLTFLDSYSCRLTFSVLDGDDIFDDLCDIPGKTHGQLDPQPLSYLDETHAHQDLLLKQKSTWSWKDGISHTHRPAKIQPWQYVWKSWD
jgi:hypothetical protein